MSFWGWEPSLPRSVQHARLSFSWLVPIRGLLMKIAAMCVVKCAFRTALYNVGCCPVISAVLPVRLWSKFCPITLAWGHGLRSGQWHLNNLDRLVSPGLTGFAGSCFAWILSELLPCGAGGLGPLVWTGQVVVCTVTARASLPISVALTGQGSVLPNGSLLKGCIASSSSQRRAPVEVFGLACFRLGNGTVAKNDVTAH